MTYRDEAVDPDVIAERHELPYTDELKRKAVHLFALVIPLGIWILGSSTALLVLAILSVIAVVSDVLRVRSEAFAAAIRRFFGFMMRPEEQPPVGGRVVLNGATWVLLSSTILLALFPPDIVILAFSAFMIADAAAAIVGRRWGRRRWTGTTRTMEGSAAFLGVAILVMVPFGWTVLWTTILACFAGAAAEIPSRPLNDNIRVPLVMATVIYAARMIGG